MQEVLGRFVTRPSRIPKRERKEDAIFNRPASSLSTIATLGLGFPDAMAGLHLDARGVQARYLRQYPAWLRF